MRIVSLTCSNTEIVCALGCSDQLVGVDEHSDWPEAAVEKLPRVGPDLGIDVARVAALKPDLVLASLTVPGHERIVAALEAAGLPFLAPEPISLSDVYASIELIASRLGVSARGDALVAAMRGEIGAGSQIAGPRPRVLVEWWPKPVICPGRDSWVNQLLEAAGGENPLEARAVKSQPLSDEDAALLGPDAVVISWCGVRPEKYRPKVVYRRASWHDVPAVRSRRVYCVPEAYLGRPGPRLVEGFRALRAIVEECLQSSGRASGSSI